jgi:transketolase
LDNLTVILDCNGVQQTGPTSSVMPTEPIVEKWTSFNWHVMETHGHNMASLLESLDTAAEIHGRPVIVVARTTKGKGVSFMENNAYWHGGIPNQDQFQAALAELQQGAKQWEA